MFSHTIYLSVANQELIRGKATKDTVLLNNVMQHIV